MVRLKINTLNKNMILIIGYTTSSYPTPNDYLVILDFAILIKLAMKIDNRNKLQITNAVDC